MKKHLKFEYNGEVIEVDAERQGDTITFERNGETHTVRVIPETPVQEKKEKAEAAPASAPAPKPSAPAAPSPQPSTQPSSAPAAAGAGQVPAPMTGVIKELLVAQGDSVQEGEPIMMMEAMKMDIEVSALSSGSVAEIYVQAGDNVKEGQALAKIG
jgi:biotin carboxyl carrier protein